MEYGLRVITEKHSEAARELFEHLDCKDDQRGLAMLDELLEYTTMLVQYMNEWQRNRNEPQQIHSGNKADCARR